MESTQFLEIFQSFTAIRSLYVSKTLVPFIAPALQELIGESATEVLPNLRDLSLGGICDIRIYTGRHTAIHRGTTALWSTCSSPSLGGDKFEMENEHDGVGHIEGSKRAHGC
jgi:hypothetical protein